MRDIEVESHTDGIGGDDVVHFARLEEFHLPVAGFGRQCPHHHCRAAAEAAQHVGHRIDLFRTECDDGAARRKAGKLGGSGMDERGKARTAGDFSLGQQRLHHRGKRGRAQQHGLLPSARMQQAVGEDMPPLRIGTELGFIERDERPVAAVPRHGFGRA